MCCVQEKNICMWHIWATVVITFWRNLVILMSTKKFHEALVQERLVHSEAQNRSVSFTEKRTPLFFPGH